MQHLSHCFPLICLVSPSPVARSQLAHPVLPEAHVFAARGWFYTDLCVTAPSSYLCVTSLHVLHLDRLAANVLHKPLLGCSRDVNAVRYRRIFLDQVSLIAVSM